MADFEQPQSRNEAILQNILGAENTLPEPQSRIETLLIDLLNQLGGGGDVASPEIGYKILNKQNISIVHGTESRARYNGYLILTQSGIVYIGVSDWTPAITGLAGYPFNVACTFDKTNYTVNIDLGYAWNVGVIIPVLNDYVTSVTFS